MQEKQSDLLKFAIQLAKESAQILLKGHKKAKILKYKGETGDFALDMDVKSENHVLQRIRKKYPHHDILTEETGHHHKTSDYLWVIDPLEGTVNYAHQLPIWGVNIGLLYKKEPFIGVCYAPVLKELFYAEKGKGTYLNGKRIHVNHETEIMKALYSSALPDVERIPISRTLIRGWSCIGVEMAYVALGSFAARIKLRGKDPYGCVTGSILVLEAGGKVTDPQGRPWSLKSEGIIASNGKLHDKLLKLINSTS